MVVFNFTYGATMNKDLQSVVLTEEQIQEKVKAAAAWLDERFADKKIGRAHV